MMKMCMIPGTVEGLRVLMVSSGLELNQHKPRPCCKRIDRGTARLIRRGLGLRFYCKDRTFEVNTLLIIWLFALSLRIRNRL